MIIRGLTFSVVALSALWFASFAEARGNMSNGRGMVNSTASPEDQAKAAKCKAQWDAMSREAQAAQNNNYKLWRPKGCKP